MLALPACAALFATLFLAPPAPDESVRLALRNGLVILLVPRAEADHALVLLGVRAGGLDEPEGRNGLAHLAEHLFLHGGTASAPAGEAFARLAEGGPLGQPFADVNAETLPNLTYFYALRRPNQVALPLALFAEKLGGVSFDEALLEIERAKALGEIAGVERRLEEQALLRAQMHALARRPKAGREAELRAVRAEEIRAFLASHYRPERCVLLVEGAFDAEAARKEIEARYGALRARPAEALADVEGYLSDGGVLLQVNEPSLAAADPALRAVLAASWQRALRATKRRAFVELAPSGALRAWIEGDDPAPLAETKDALRRPLAEKEWKRVVRDAGAEARQQKLFLEQALPASSPRTQKLLAEAQRSIYRLRFEAEGREAFLERLSSLTPEQLAELAAKL